MFGTRFLTGGPGGRSGWLPFAALMALSYAEVVSPRLPPSDASVYFLPNALLFLRLCGARRSSDAAIAIAIFVAAAALWVSAGAGRLADAAPYVAIDVAAAGALAAGVRRYGRPRFALRPAAAALAFLTAAAVVAACAGVAAALVPLPLTPRAAAGIGFWDQALPFAAGDFTAYATLGAAALMLRRLTRPRMRGLLAGRRYELRAAVAALAAAVIYDFGLFDARDAPHPALLFVSYPPLVWLSFRFRELGAPVAILLTAVPSIQFAAAGQGPFWLDHAADKVLVLQAYVTVCAISAAMIAALAGSIADRERRLATALATAERRARANGDFLMRIGHELRTPLNAICGFADIIGHGAEGDAGRARDAIFAREIARAGERMAALVDEALDITRGGAITLRLRPGAFPVAVLVDEALAPFAAGATEAGVRIEVAAPPEVSVWADPVATRHVIGHLLSNALRHARTGGRVSFAARREAGRIVIDVRDDGPGFRPGHWLDGDPFVKRTDGAGLGLALVETLMAAQGGAFSIASTEGAGASARLEFPAPPSDAQAP